jgi:ATP phosphoribosyltransferase regulatory subunit
MPNLMSKTLLPAGLMDVLPPEASFEAKTVEGIVRSFSSYGYDRVKPPLIEFEEGLLSGSCSSSDIVNQTFRMMDPISQKMMGVRVDMTMQVSRIASSRLANQPRPLRLSYAGSVLRVKGSQLRPARQFTQAGAELIGADCAKADVEIIETACNALNSIGIDDITVDLTIPTLVPAICADYDLDSEQYHYLRMALDQKDISSVNEALEDKKDLASLIVSLMDMTSIDEENLQAIKALNLNDEAAKQRDRVLEVIDVIKKEKQDINMTIDFVENRGFEYHTGVSFSLFSSSSMSEVGRGGRYIVGNNGQKNGINNGECATGVTLFLDSIMKIIKIDYINNRVFIPEDAPLEKIVELVNDGFVIVRGLQEVTDNDEEARRMNCKFVLAQGQIKSIS